MKGGGVAGIRSVSKRERDEEGGEGRSREEPVVCVERFGRETNLN